jgi:hypothetical protein
MSEHNQQFDSFEQWVNKASSWLTRHHEYYDAEHSKAKGWAGYHFTAMCFDAKNRRCRNGGDFMRARDENAFPVRWIWPDQLPAMLEVFDDLLEYFDGKQDAETFPDGRTIANEEMKFHMRISAILEGKTYA